MQKAGVGTTLSRWRERFDSARERHCYQWLTSPARYRVQHLANIRVWTVLYAIALIPLVIGCVFWPKVHTWRDQLVAALTAPDGR